MELYQFRKMVPIKKSELKKIARKQKWSKKAKKNGNKIQK